MRLEAGLLDNSAQFDDSEPDDVEDEDEEEQSTADDKEGIVAVTVVNEQGQAAQRKRKRKRKRPRNAQRREAKTLFHAAASFATGVHTKEIGSQTRTRKIGSQTSRRKIRSHTKEIGPHHTRKSENRVDWVGSCLWPRGSEYLYKY